MTRHRYKQSKAALSGSVQRMPIQRRRRKKDAKPLGDRTHTDSQKNSLTVNKAFKLPIIEWASANLYDMAISDLPPVPTTFTRPDDLPAAKLLAVEGMRIFGVLVWACRLSGIGRRVVYELFRADPAFKKAMEDARRECFEELEAAMIRRGHYVKGDLAGIFTLKHNNKKYREVSRVELSGPGGTPIAYEETKGELLSRLGKLTQSLAVDAEVRTLAAGSAGSGGGSGRPALVPPERPIIRKLKKGA